MNSGSHVWIGWLLGCALLTQLGCQPSASEPVLNEASQESLTSPSAAGSDTQQATGNLDHETEVQVTVGGRSTLDSLVAGHRGKVVLVDFWATWCVPCMKQFPHTVELAKWNPDQLAVIAVSMDEPDALEQVRRFLAKHDARFDHLLSEYGVGQESFEKFEITDGAIPHYKIFDRQGQLRHTVSDVSLVDALIDPLLEKENP